MIPTTGCSLGGELFIGEDLKLMTTTMMLTIMMSTMMITTTIMITTTMMSTMMMSKQEFFSELFGNPGNRT